MRKRMGMVLAVLLLLLTACGTGGVSAPQSEAMSGAEEGTGSGIGNRTENPGRDSAENEPGDGAGQSIPVGDAVHTAENAAQDEGDAFASETAFTEESADDYAYINPNGQCISERFNPPEGFARMEAGGFGSFLRSYPLLADGSEVLLYDGSRKWDQEAHAAVFDMDLVPGDLQQCADSCIRLYAEYFYRNGMYDKIAFHLVNGFLVDFDTWRAGDRVAVDGNRTEWVMSAEPSDSQETFESYLRFVFTYASTLSMDNESASIAIGDLRAGDLFIKGGSPGHVVMVLDVCENAAGEKAFLLGQGYMPAQQFHVLKNLAHEDDPWYYEGEMTYPFGTPEYVFSEGSLKRPAYGQ